MAKKIIKKNDVKYSIDEMKGSLNIIATSFAMVAVIIALSLIADQFWSDVCILVAATYCVFASIYLLIQSRNIED